jgi:hypothetical protein
VSLVRYELVSVTVPRVAVVGTLKISSRSECLWESLLKGVLAGPHHGTGRF